ncbi:NAD(P)-binding protein [Umbelopsis sp. PMI_123]|nr:NAD(P)-binding protein [Umbelopsis sp. PMI_123]
MVKVLIFGATGIIGKEDARAFSRNGHTVYGITRSAKKAHELEREEIIGAVADTIKPSTWKHLIKNVSVIVDTSFNFAIPADVSEAVKEYHEKRYTFIYTSGTWVYGNSVGIPIDESALEKAVIESKDFDGVVIRPGLVLGKTGSIFGVCFGAVESGQVTLYNDVNVRFAVVYTNDLVETYVAAAEKIHVTKGKTFNVVNRKTEYVTDLINALARLINPEAKITYQAPADPFSRRTWTPQSQF